jgi:putative heme utilization carrier protein HutX
MSATENEAGPQGAEAALRHLMTTQPDTLFERAAQETGLTCRAAVEALPQAMRRIAPGEAFVAAMDDMTTWGDVTFLIHTDDGIFEISGPVPSGKIGGSYFNLSGPTALHGHLRYERCAAIAFVERPFMGRPSASALFINVDGGFMFKVFVGRDAARELKADQLVRFRELADRLCR